MDNCGLGYGMDVLCFIFKRRLAYYHDIGLWFPHWFGLVIGWLDLVGFVSDIDLSLS